MPGSRGRAAGVKPRGPAPHHAGSVHGPDDDPGDDDPASTNLVSTNLANVALRITNPGSGSAWARRPPPTGRERPISLVGAPSATQ